MVIFCYSERAIAVINPETLLQLLTDDCQNIAAILRALADRQYVFKITKELRHWVVHCSWFSDDLLTANLSQLVQPTDLLCWWPLLWHGLCCACVILLSMPMSYLLPSRQSTPCFLKKKPLIFHYNSRIFWLIYIIFYHWKQEWIHVFHNHI